MAETNLRRGLMLSDGSFMGFLSNPISAVFLLLALTSTGWHLFSSIRSKNARNATLLRT
ncbi:hypothetical protein D9M68_710740 [compost metagenome]